MEYLKPVILGIVQGFTEFLPISSSAHLIFLQNYFNMKNMVAFDVLLHFATLLAILVFFRKDVINLLKSPRLMFLVIIVTIPTGLIGYFLEDFIDELFSSNVYPAAFLLVSGVLLYVGQYYSKETKNLRTLKKTDAFIIGIVQGLAVLPGISRSGSTITASLLVGCNRTDAMKFSFLVAIPAIAGAGLLELRKIESTINIFSLQNIAGMIAAFICGLMALYILRKALEKARLSWFSYYCWIVGTIMLILISAGKA
ncbi:MAG: hypothetical protein A2252_05205 [Elusimicrobia bacterium RIFOXYA2_FULL_39_19]|nr:MAG: hypothetical protein A2252_05205 [Elusimicrobia bacterium RIFOXYA2_FULL_39_19]